MRYVNIFLLHFQYVFEQRGRSFVWFLTSTFNPLLLILFWRGAIQNTQQMFGWNISSISTYYFYLTIAGAMLMSHTEDDVAYDDIQQGYLVRYLIQPFSYFWKKFIEEIPYRILQGTFGILVCILISFFFNIRLTFVNSIWHVPIVMLIFFSAYLLAFSFKMIMALTAFWFTDARGFYNFIEITLIIFAGYILPISLMPSTLSAVANLLPFIYMIYYPIVALQGTMQLIELLRVLLFQIVWLITCAFVYRILWNLGVKKFTGMGQ